MLGWWLIQWSQHYFDPHRAGRQWAAALLQQNSWELAVP